MCKILWEIPEGLGVYFSLKTGDFREVGRSYLKFSLCKGYGYFLEPQNVLAVLVFLQTISFFFLQVK